ncbi:MAG: hypothetical protein WB566_09960 [Terriglobales bacterium]
MDQAPGVLLAEQRIPRPRPAPRLRLLTELEPRHRVFFGNLADLLLARRVPEPPITSRPGVFWHDVFVPSGISWISFLESMIWHVLVLTLFVWAQSRVWEPVKLFPERETIHRTITYYPPPTPAHTFQASESRAGVRPHARVRPSPPQPAARPAPMPATPERKPRMVTPPDIKEATAKLPNVLTSHAVTPMPPLSATAELRRKGLAGPSAVVAPAPQVDKATGRQLTLPQAAAVAPAPDLVAGTAGRTIAGQSMKTPNSVQIVPPPPSVQSAGSARRGRLSSLSGGPNVVAAPPSVARAGFAAGDPRLRSLRGAGSQVVPPAPSLQSGSSNGSGRLSSLPGARPNVVLPPPSVPGDAAGGRLGSLTGTGSQVIPPPPSVQSAGGPAGHTRAALGGVGSEVVAPAPSVEGSSGRGGRFASLSGDSAPVLAPHAPGAAAGNIGGGGTGKILEPMDPLPVDAASSAMTAANENQSSVEELPLGFLGVVFAAPGTSFFSNFEVFVAKRRVGKELQLIKLVYEFLPYQRRLSEYDLNNLPPRVIKLRVIPDPSCDEALGHIIQPPTEAASTGAESPKIPAALRAFDPNSVLPCYRTTATDFQKAMSGGH